MRFHSADAKMRKYEYRKKAAEIIHCKIDHLFSSQTAFFEWILRE